MEKILSVIRWFSIAIILDTLISVLSYIVYPIVYPIRNFIRKWYNSDSKIKRILITPLWIFLADGSFEENGHEFGNDWWLEAKNTKLDTSWRKFWAAYQWNVLRNPAWNRYLLIKPQQGEPEIVSQSGKLYREEYPVSIMDFANLKYVNDKGEFRDNKGDFLSMYFSIFGKSFVWYRINNRLYWRYSLAKRVKPFGFWIELHAGTNDRRYTIRGKIKFVKIYEEQIKTNL